MLKSNASETELKGDKMAHSYYNTSEEISFLNRLGTFGVANLTPVPVLLRGYIKAAEKRHDLGSVDGQAVIAHARERLAQL